MRKKRIGLIVFFLLYIFVTTKISGWLNIEPYQVGISLHNDFIGVIAIDKLQVASIILFLLINLLLTHIEIRISLKRIGLGFLFGIPSFLIMFLNIVQGDKIVLKAMSPGGWSLKILLMTILYALISGLVIGVFEELLFRGVIFELLTKIFKKNAPIKAIIGSSLIFGLTHAINYLDSPFWDTTNQIVYAIGIGMLFATIYYVTGNLLVPILLHSLIDMTDIIFSMNTNLLDKASNSGLNPLSFLIFVGFSIISLLILRYYKIEKQA